MKGFHQMLMSNWDPYLTIEVLTSWMGCMMRAEMSDDDNSAVTGECRGGWIPRELILGQEAFKVVPSEFVTQRVDIANPPTLLIVVEKLVEKWQQGRRNAKQCDNVNAKVGGEGYCDLNADFDKFHGEIVSFLKDSYFSLHDWVQWFIDSQSAGDVSTSPATAFRWRGRSEDSSRLAPNTLASGLDDYPRSQYPSSDEQHVDLLSWVAMSCRVMQKVGTAIVEAAAGSDFDGHESFVAEVDRVNQEFYSDEIFAKFMDSLISVHWSDADKTFYDIGLVGDNERIDEGVTVRCTDDKRGGGTADVLVEIERLQNSRGREPSLCPTDFPRYLDPLGDGNGGLRMGNIFSSSPSRVVGFVPRVGYVNIFPFILKLLPSDSPQLEHMLDLVSFSKGLGSVHGLRSLSKKDLFYQKENAPGDAPYWR
jgi:mannosyl-oligosaccharide glucosidase